MLKRLHLRNFTVFEDADFAFGPGLNVLVGANGTGKSHVLKAGYALARHLHETLGEKDLHWFNSGNISSPLYDLLKVFRPIPFEGSQLIRRGMGEYKATITLGLVFSGGDVETTIELPINQELFLVSDASASELKWLNKKDETIAVASSVFIPAKEAITLGWLLPLYDRREIPIDETYPDLLRLLMGPPLRQPEPAHIVAQLQQLIGGKVEEEGGHFYLAAPEQPRMEMNLVAEGVRKFATLYKLLANGTLTPETTLFWDEPDTNFNPALLKEMAAVLTQLAKAGFQIILATHSLFLLKELHILARREKQPVRYFGLSAEPGGATTVATADNLELLPDIVALDAELDQSDRFQRVLDQEDADRN